VEEIRKSFTKYEDITLEALTQLEYLHASLMETMRLTVIGATGMPRVSPGATVDGIFIPKGVRNPPYDLLYDCSLTWFI
jgi:hypothetical protein